MYLYLQRQKAEETCAFLVDVDFLFHCGPYLRNKNYYYENCKKDMCRNEPETDYTPMCTWTEALEHDCVNAKVWDVNDVPVDWSFNNYTQICGKFKIFLHPN